MTYSIETLRRLGRLVKAQRMSEVRTLGGRYFLCALVAIDDEGVETWQAYEILPPTNDPQPGGK